jgi:hypothetical protein
MTKQIPNPEQIRALQIWALLHGRKWKNALAKAWSDGNYQGFHHYPYLQQLRNNFGPSWLVRYKVPAAEPASGAATSYNVVTNEAHTRGPGLRLGGVSLKRDGWYFIPAFQASPSRRGWPNPEAALQGRVSNYSLVAVVRPAPQL